mmetsp:Transcript_5446/g.16508  ORF Transcript_5446/g.16508 Transcript_5446/m.16508 type:complete len:203 (-) Transcript_5446:1124-1732(-)
MCTCMPRAGRMGSPCRTPPARPHPFRFVPSDAADVLGGVPTLLCKQPDRLLALRSERRASACEWQACRPRQVQPLARGVATLVRRVLAHRLLPCPSTTALCPALHPFPPCTARGRRDAHSGCRRRGACGNGNGGGEGGGSCVRGNSANLRVPCRSQALSWPCLLSPGKSAAVPAVPPKRQPPPPPPRFHCMRVAAPAGSAAA